jgi:prepilin-type N-terminal cleavage/methylation domain-containing protein
MAVRSKASEGFTLIELMIVVVVIAVVAGAAAPAIGASVRERKTSTAALDLARAFRTARSSAAGYGVAYMVAFSEEADGGRGALQVFRGDKNRCNAVAWGAPTLPQVDQYSGSAIADDPDWRIQVRTAQGSSLQVCYEPTGVTYWRLGVAMDGGGADFGRFSAESPTSGGSATGGFRFTVERIEDGAVQGVARAVVVPLGGDPRVAR